MKKRLLASLLALCLVFALAACGEAPAAESGEPAAASEEPAGDLVAYELDGIGTAYLPAGGEVTLTPVTEPLPQMQATIAFEGFTVYIGSTGPEAYEISGVDFPASVEEFSQRSGPQSDVPAGSEFAYDDHGNYFVQFARDGQDHYYVIRLGEETAYAITFICPEGELANYDAAGWISTFEFIELAPFEEAPAPAAELAAYEVEGVGTFYFPAGATVERNVEEEPLPVINGSIDLGDGVCLVYGSTGRDAFELAGVEFPVDAEDYATRPAVVDYVGEGAEFAYDGCGNYYTQYTRDGSDVYYVAERNAARVNTIVFYCPEGELGSYSPAEWISMAELYGDPSEELTAYEVAGVGTIYMPEGGEVYGEEQAEPLPNVQAGINLGDTNIHFGAFTAESYEAAGVAWPADEVEFSTRSGVTSSIPADAVFEYDDFGNYVTRFTVDGEDHYVASIVTDTLVVLANFTCPEGQMDAYQPGIWLSLSDFAG